MKYLINIIIILLFTLTTNAQFKDSVKNTYEFTYNGSIKNKNTVTNFLGILLQNDTLSAWGEEISANNKPVNNDSLKQIIRHKDFSFIIFKNFAKNEIVFTQEGGFLEDKINVFSDTINMFKWILKDDKKIISNFKCKKAFCEFRGRKYEAWYSQEIPTINGPWKFGNLPGLIVEINSIDKYVTWKLVGVKNSNKKVPNGLSTNETFEDYKKKVRRGYKRFLESMGASDQIDPTCKSCQTTRIIKIESTENIFD
jgi:GLPGLI family protein